MKKTKLGRKSAFLSAIFISLLIVLIPVAIAKELDNYDTIQTKEQFTPLYAGGSSSLSINNLEITPGDISARIKWRCSQRCIYSFSWYIDSGIIGTKSGIQFSERHETSMPYLSPSTTYRVDITVQNEAGESATESQVFTTTLSAPQATGNGETGSGETGNGETGNGEATSNLELNPYERDNLPDAAAATVIGLEKTSSYVDLLDNGIISTLEQIASVLYAICTTMSAVESTLGSVSLVVGMITGDKCCAPGPTAAVRCTAMAKVYNAWSKVYSKIKPLCCFVNCGWCSGSDTDDDNSCWGANWLDDFNMGELVPNLGLSQGFEGAGGALSDEVPAGGGLGFGGPIGQGAGIGQLGWSPYDNIYFAIGCVCPIAILFNLRKLKTIYQVYDCCIQQSVLNDMGTEQCEAQFSEATCMFYEGSLYSSVAKVIVGLVSGMIIRKISGTLIKSPKLSGFLMCAYAVFKLSKIPGVIDGVNAAYEYVGRTFDEPTCEDLGFDELRESLQEDYVDIAFIDLNNDGIYD
jgi:hypothetical protein